jgi:hypothetical protein
MKPPVAAWTNVTVPFNGCVVMKLRLRAAFHIAGDQAPPQPLVDGVV